MGDGALAAFKLPAVRNLPVTEFSSGRASSRHDAPLWNCAPTPAARTAPGTVCLTSAVIIHFGFPDQSNTNGRALSKSGRLHPPLILRWF